jgi:hypothetical protein
MQLTVIYALFATFHSQDKSRYDLATAKEQWHCRTTSRFTQTKYRSHYQSEEFLRLVSLRMKIIFKIKGSTDLSYFGGFKR